MILKKAKASSPDFWSTSAKPMRGNEFNSIFNTTETFSAKSPSIKAGLGAGGRKKLNGPQAQLNLTNLRARREAQIMSNRKAKRSSRMAMQGT